MAYSRFWAAHRGKHSLLVYSETVIGSHFPKAPQPPSPNNLPEIPKINPVYSAMGQRKGERIPERSLKRIPQTSRYPGVRVSQGIWPLDFFAKSYIVCVHFSLQYQDELFLNCLGGKKSVPLKGIALYPATMFHYPHWVGEASDRAGGRSKHK